jgi:hypothetical protein
MAAFARRIEVLGPSQTKEFLGESLQSSGANTATSIPHHSLTFCSLQYLGRTGWSKYGPTSLA